MLALGWTLFGAGLVIAVSMWIIARENGRDARETEEAELTRLLEQELEIELSGAQEGAWRP
jgi:hypothetical protein